MPFDISDPSIDPVRLPGVNIPNTDDFTYWTVQILVNPAIGTWLYRQELVFLPGFPFDPSTSVMLDTGESLTSGRAVLSAAGIFGGMGHNPFKSLAYIVFPLGSASKLKFFEIDIAAGPLAVPRREWIVPGASGSVALGKLAVDPARNTLYFMVKSA